MNIYVFINTFLNRKSVIKKWLDSLSILFKLEIICKKSLDSCQCFNNTLKLFIKVILKNWLQLYIETIFSSSFLKKREIKKMITWKIVFFNKPIQDFDFQLDNL